MKKRILAGTITVGIALALSGCGNAIPEMNEEEQALVVEYAAGELLKYDANYAYRLMEPVELPVEEIPVEEDSIPEEPETPDVESENVEPTPVVEELPEETAPTTLDAFLELDNFEITYQGYEVTDFYPKSDTSETYFVMNATDGNELLVLKFTVKNISGEEAELDIAQKNIRFKLVVDGQEKNALTTMLLNDLVYYKGTIGSGESEELVLVGEVTSEQSGAIQSLGITMKNGSESATVTLQ